MTMKKLFVLIAVFLCLALVVACTTGAVSSVRDFETEGYRSGAELEIFKSLVDGNSMDLALLPKDRSPYILQDVASTQGCTITDVTIPVYSTGKADKKGNYIFTLRVLDVVNGNFIETDKVYRINVNGRAFGLSDDQNKIMQFIELDVASYGITVGENQVLAFSDKDDTLTLFYLSISGQTALTEIGKINPAALGFFPRYGRLYNSGVIPVDFSWVADGRTQQKQEEEAYYASLIAKLKEKYQGKQLSIMGDSISTFSGITNSASYNSTLQGGAVYYKIADERMPSSSFMYWKRLADDLGMEICVPNAWSGSRVYGKSDTGYADAGVLRAVQLDNDNGTPDDPSDDINPDLIIVFLGINDLHGLGTGYAKDIKKMVGQAGEDEAKLKSLIDEWFAALLQVSEDGTKLEAGVTYKSFDQAYALMLYRMKRAYPDAQIITCDFFGNGHNSFTKDSEEAYCRVVKVLSEYFGIECLQWSQTIGITRANARFFTVDPVANALHPGPYGQLLMERQILEKLASIH